MNLTHSATSRNVYVLMYTGWPEDTIVGVFSTQQGAYNAEWMDARETGRSPEEYIIEARTVLP